jgi:hypothetical protein
MSGGHVSGSTDVSSPENRARRFSHSVKHGLEADDVHAGHPHSSAAGAALHLLSNLLAVLLTNRNVL